MLCFIVFCVCYAPAPVGALTGIRVNSVSRWHHWFPRRYSQEGRARVDPVFVNADAILPMFHSVLCSLENLSDMTQRLWISRCSVNCCGQERLWRGAHSVRSAIEMDKYNTIQCYAVLHVCYYISYCIPFTDWLTERMNELIKEWTKWFRYT